MKKIFKSLRSRVIICILLVGIIPVLLLHFITINIYKYTLMNAHLADARQRCSSVAAMLSHSEELKSTLTNETNRVISWGAETYNGRLIIVDSSFKIIFDTFQDADLGKTCISDSVFSALMTGKEYDSYVEASGYFEYVFPVVYESSEEKIITGAIVISSNAKFISEALTKCRQTMLFIDLIFYALTVLLSIYISYLIIRPIVNVKTELFDFSYGKSGKEMMVRSYSEIDGILESTSHIIGKYQEIDKLQAEFVSNVSHELKTPMTSIRVLSDSLIGQRGISEEIYQEFLGDISKEVDRETHIIEDLLSMVRLGKASDKINITTKNINEFIIDLLKSIKPIADERQVELLYEHFRQVYADIDEIKLNQALSNLVENAVKYNNEGGWVKVSIDADHEYCYFKISDNGIGIPENALPHIFERFYRVDKARSRDSGGTGLGLAITKSIILLHNGLIKVESVVGEGTVFSVRIPLKYEANDRPAR